MIKLIIDLKNIYYDNNEAIQIEINNLLDKYKINDDNVILSSLSDKIVINDKKHTIEVTKSSKHPYHYIDIIRVLFKYYINKSNDIKTEEFIKDASIPILKYTDLFKFKFIDIDISRKQFPIYKFELNEVLFNMEIDYFDNNNKEMFILNINVYNTENDTKTLIVKKIHKKYGHIYFDMLYQSILFIYCLISYIKGNEVWGN